MNNMEQTLYIFNLGSLSTFCLPLPRAPTPPKHKMVPKGKVIKQLFLFWGIACQFIETDEVVSVLIRLLILIFKHEMIFGTKYLPLNILISKHEMILGTKYLPLNRLYAT